MIKAASMKVVMPTKKWMLNVLQKSSGSRNNFSETRVTIPEKSRKVQPEGRHLRKENEDESWKKPEEYIIVRIQGNTDFLNPYMSKIYMHQGNTWK